MTAWSPPGTWQTSPRVPGPNQPISSGVACRLCSMGCTRHLNCQVQPWTRSSRPRHVPMEQSPPSRSDSDNVSVNGAGAGSLGDIVSSIAILYVPTGSRSLSECQRVPRLGHPVRRPSVQSCSQLVFPSDQRARLAYIPEPVRHVVCQPSVVVLQRNVRRDDSATSPGPDVEPGGGQVEQLRFIDVRVEGDLSGRRYTGVAVSERRSSRAGRGVPCAVAWIGRSEGVSAFDRVPVRPAWDG